MAETRLMNFQCPEDPTRRQIEAIRRRTGHSFTAIFILAIETMYDSYESRHEHESERMNVMYLDEKTLKIVNAALVAAGYAPYPGDRTTAQPQGCGAGFVMNLVDSIAGADPDARREVRGIVARIVS